MPLISMDDGIGLHVEADPENGKPSVLFLNALGADHTMWDEQMPAFREHFRVIRMDDRGHGQSEAPDMPYTIDRLGRDARAVLEAVDVESAHVVGLSKGGMTAAWLGANSPEHIEKLVIVSAAPHLAPRDVWEGRAKTARTEGGLHTLAEAAIGRWFTESFRAKNPEAIAKVRAMIMQTAPAGYAACCEALAEMDLRDDLALIPSPTLVLVGDSDPTSHPGKTREWVATIEGAQLQIIKQAAHLCNIEQAANFNKIALDFLLAN
ncbi:3-oxoadipate enol-lactonase [Kaistia dalseonensis]|uniref:3-oxoadipate enol-lactonase n=1 Tax=Kaistia dalseonensis TaxID=410840 RepID=A0ABU0HBB9_9HYPH|nr:3-oxoadipate enol-lactonase [Kaistia dalseonensis]MCX5496986.1 3-oxoadipate enol-lactonase [Kaistia dalseonensis]MDQ0439612.1 3-oxoadipate enol-lactonase [Kaistia dalseonensis]